MKTMQLLILLFLIPLCGFAQTPLELKKGRINTTNGVLIKFSSLKQTDDGFRYYLSGSKVEKIIATDNVLKIEKKSGNQAVLFGVILGASGLLGSFLGTKMAEKNLESQGMTVDKNVQSTTIIALTGVSALIGVIWGANTPKYSKVYENPKYSGLFHQRLQFYCTMHRTTQIGFIYHF
jgi:hypothetical protein